MTFYQKLDAISAKNKSLVCIGLDTDVRKIPEHLRSNPNPVLAFNRAIVEATSDLVQSYKLNLAFYEVLGAGAFETVKGTLECIPPDVVTIGDAKRGDIGNTASMYAQTLFEEFSFDAATVAPYMGFDSVEPFLAYGDKGVIILTLTSNRGSRDFQYLDTGGEPLYVRVAGKIIEWNTAGNCGAVVGATHPRELAELRALLGDIPILVPGLGAQGGDVEKSVKAGVNSSGLRAVFNSSRAILYAGTGLDFAEKAREAAIGFRSEINGFRLVS